MEQKYRKNVGIMVVNTAGKIWLGHRASRWHGAYCYQCAQGGIDDKETPEHAAARELYEETGLTDKNTRFIAKASQWYTYDFAPDSAPHLRAQGWVGQTQQWFLVLFTGKDTDFRFNVTDEVEFSEFKWVDIDEVVEQIVPFKRPVYEQVVAEFKPMIEHVKSNIL